MACASSRIVSFLLEVTLVLIPIPHFYSTSLPLCRTLCSMSHVSTPARLPLDVSDSVCVGQRYFGQQQAAQTDVQFSLRRNMANFILLFLTRSIPDGVIPVFHPHDPSGRTVSPGVESASNRNEYQEYFLWGKGGRRVRMTT